MAVNRATLAQLFWVLPLTLAVCAAYELALALGNGTHSWETGGIAILAMIVGAVFAPLLAGSWNARGPVALLAPAAAAYLAAFYYTFDPYYSFPKRYIEAHASDRLTALVFGLLAAAIAVGILTRFRPRKGGFATTALLGITVLITIVVSDGH